jgi:anti-anti-sigma factor
LKLNGTIDANTFERLESTLETAFARHIVRIIVDLSDVREISSSGTGVFVSALSLARDQQGNVVLLNVSKGVQEVFDILGLTGQFPVAPDREAALALVYAPAGASSSNLAIKVPDSGSHKAIS